MPNKKSLVKRLKEILSHQRKLSRQIDRKMKSLGLLARLKTNLQEKLIETCK